MSIASFSEPTALQFDHELKKLEAQPICGLVIDLRGNPGGLLETAADMLSRFVDDKVVVKMKFRDGKEEVVRTYSGETHDFNYPIDILINEDSASAAEIFSGVLHDYGKATLVGTHSYGKSSVQSVFPLVDQSSAKITIARYYLPITPYYGRVVDEDGAYISGGLEPDVKVDLNDSAEMTPGDPKTDNQLRKAIDVVLAKSRP
jgi:carboxyl-terminal processing protease